MTDEGKNTNEYSPMVVEHMRNPHNWGIMHKSDGYARATGPCGDTMEISLQVKDGLIRKCTFDTDGCGATVSCGSIVTEMVTNRTVSQARCVDQAAILAYCGGLPEVHKHCALLAAMTLQKALEDYEGTRNETWRRLYRVT
jgi:nitrogen fixation NifU-like protein